MNTLTNPSEATWLNPAVLKWAREWRGRTVEEAAKHVKKEPRQILDWERGIGAPTVRQARQLVQFYGWSFLELFLPTLPQVAGPSAIPDFRMQRDTKPPADNWKLRDTLRWAETQRINALDLYEELGETPPSIPNQLFASRDEDADKAAAQCRDGLGFSIQDQIKMPKKDARSLPSMLRQLVESIGVLTLRTPVLKELKVRGICIARYPLPVIVFSNEAPTAQAFTIMHEFAHVLLKESGITGERSRGYYAVPVERWCDRFAASFLIPSEQLTAIVGTRPSQPASAIEDNELARLAEIFRVSPHAMLVRLVQLRYVDENFYWGIKKPLFEREEESYNSFARSSYYGSRYRLSHGDLYTRLVLEAWTADKITNHNAAEYLGIKNIAHLDAIRGHFGAS